MNRHKLLRHALLSTSLLAVLAHACTVKDDGPDTDDSGGEASGAKGGTGGTGGSASPNGGVQSHGGSAAGGDSTTDAGAPNGPDAGAGGSGGAPDGASSGGTGGDGELGGAGGDPGSAGTTGVGGKGNTNPPLDGPVVMQVTTASNPAVPGGRLLYTITLGNVTNRAIAGVKLLMRLPEGLQFTYAGDAEPDSSYCGNAVCEPSEEASWTIASIPAGATETITVNAGVLTTVGDGDSIATLFTLSAPGMNDLNLTKTTEVYSSPAAQLALGAAFDPVVPGQTFDLELDVGQIGASPLAHAELAVQVPSYLSVVSVSDGGTEPEDGNVTWSLGTVPVGATLHRTITVKAASSLTPGAVQAVRAELTYDGGVALDAVNEYSISFVAESPPVQVLLNPVMAPAVPGGRIAYTATISNLSSRALETVSLLLRTPAALEYAYAGDAEPDSSYCGNAVCSADEEAEWTIPSLPAGTSQTITLNPSVVSTVAGDGSLIPTRLNVRAKGVNPMNVFKAVPVHVNPAAQLSLGTAVDPVIPGQSFTYELDVGQIGTAALAGTTLTLDLPSGVTVDAISNGGTESSPGHVQWTLGTVPVAGTARRTVTVTVDDDLLPGTLIGARAGLAYTGGSTVDVIAEHPVTVVAAPLPLTITVGTSANTATLGSRLLYTTTITNTSARAIEGVSLWLRVPEGLQFAYAADANPDSSYCGNAVCSGYEEAVWSLGTLAAGAVQTVTVNPAVAASLTGGSLVTAYQRLTATGLGGTINVKKTVPTQN